MIPPRRTASLGNDGARDFAVPRAVQTQENQSDTGAGARGLGGEVGPRRNLRGNASGNASHERRPRGEDAEPADERPRGPSELPRKGVPSTRAAPRPRS